MERKPIPTQSLMRPFLLVMILEFVCPQREMAG